MEGFELTGGSFRARVLDESGTFQSYILGPLFDNSTDAWRFLNAAQPFVFRSDSYHTRGLDAAMIRCIARYFHATGVHAMPSTGEQWQAAIVKIYNYHLSGKPGRASLDTRMSEWQGSIKPLFEFLRDIESLIPKRVRIPPKKRVRANHTPDFKVRTLAQGRTTPLATADEVNESSALLLNLDLSRTDAEYLENFRDRLIGARAALDVDCVQYVTSMAEHFQYGQRMLKLFSEAAADKFEATYPGTSKLKGGEPYHEMREDLEQENYPGATEISFARILRFFLRATPNAKLKKTFRYSPWLPSWQSVRIPASAPQPPHDALNSDTRRFRWMLGLVDIADLAIIHLLLTIRNPRFNATPLFNATLKDNHDRSNFTMVVDGTSFSVNKRRAKARKSSTLDNESILAIDTLLKMTKTARDSMVETDPLKNRLFFATTYMGPKGFKYQALYSFNADRRCLAYFLPKSSELELPPNHINALRVRRTTAVLEWFATGSVLAAARKLGNTTKVVIKHYIPEELIKAWSTRLIRRFQNLLLATAAAHAPYLLRATDFSTPEELKKFISDMLSQHAASSSKLAAIMHGRFRNPENFPAPEDAPAATDPSSLVVSVSPANLAILYAFRDLAYEKGIEAMASGKKNSKEISPGAIVDLADLLNTRLPDHHDPRFRAAHVEAQLLAPHIVANMREGSAFAVYQGEA